MVDEEAKLILGFPKHIKLGLLTDALCSNRIGIFFELSKILLDAPISKGGISSDEIYEIHQKYLNAL
jgi:hypothetical protein